MNYPTAVVTDDRLETQIRMAESQNNNDLCLLLLELKQYRVINKVSQVQDDGNYVIYNDGKPRLVDGWSAL